MNRFLHLPAYQLTSLPVYQFTSLPVYQFTSLPVYQFTSLPVYQFTSLPVYQFTSLPVHRLIGLSVLRSRHDVGCGRTGDVSGVVQTSRIRRMRGTSRVATRVRSLGMDLNNASSANETFQLPTPVGASVDGDFVLARIPEDNVQTSQIERKRLKHLRIPQSLRLDSVLAAALAAALIMLVPASLPARARVPGGKDASEPSGAASTVQRELAQDTNKERPFNRTLPVRSSTEQTRMSREQVLEKFQNIPLLMLTDMQGRGYKLNQASADSDAGADAVPLFMSPVEMIRFMRANSIPLEKSSIRLIGFEDGIKLAQPSRQAGHPKHVIVPSQEAVDQARVHAPAIRKRMEKHLIIPLFSCDGLTLSRDGIRSSPVFLDSRDLMTAWNLARRQNQKLPRRPKIIVGDALSLRLMLLDAGMESPIESIHIFPSEETLQWIAAQTHQKAPPKK
ncbi:hypothetical protein FVE85_9263 [Porphyridium purpureum]|uniref:Tic22-like family protein n=1 Tax=Porphyridium purpureum TaxID=35688 RepID=A0A5J4YNA4_PORPP|nr:hypothetical protein FVE85_9263 [Porphyridium purpureum]|eukprot:POR2940..scf222_8